MPRRIAKNKRNVQRNFQGPHADSQPEGSDDGQNSDEENRAYLLTLGEENKAYLLALGGTPGGPKNATAQSEKHKKCTKKTPGATCGSSARRKRRWRIGASTTSGGGSGREPPERRCSYLEVDADGGLCGCGYGALSGRGAEEEKEEP